MSTAKKLTTIAENQQKVYEAGRSKEWNDFWDATQSKGQRTDYNYFGRTGWNRHTFKPKYSFIIKGAGNEVFSRMYVYDFTEWFREHNLTIDTSQCTSSTQIFYDCSGITHLGVIDLSKSKGVWYAFGYCLKLHTIDKLIVSEVTTDWTLAFSQCNSLKNIQVEGTFAYSVNFSSSPLSLESCKSIITALKDYSGTNKEFKYTLTLSDTAKSYIEAEGATSPNGNTWLDYIADKKWNLA